jgi:signal transduction histidine kinase
MDELRVEYMDTKNMSSASYYDELIRMYKLKYNPDDFDVIISTDDNALAFLIDHKKELFNDTPVFFCGINIMSNYELASLENYYGLGEKNSLRDTVEMALVLNPDIENVYFVVDESVSGKATNRDARMDMLDYGQDINFHIYENMSYDELLDAVSGLDPLTDVVIQSVFVIDSDGNDYPIEYTSKQLMMVSPVPVYSLYPFGFGQGNIGGKFIEGYSQGTRVALMATEYLNTGQVSGEKYISDSEHNRYFFDYDALRKFGLDINKLPENHIAINDPPSVYERHKNVINAFLGIFVLLALYVLLLRRQVRKQTQRISTTQKHLMESEKMASLGRLVAGIAHEINTPIGVGVSLSSYMHSETGKIEEEFNKATLSKSKLSDYIERMHESSELMSSTMKRVSEMVQSFKQVSVDHSHDMKRETDLCEYMYEIISSLKSELKHNHIHVNVHCDESQVINIHTGAIYQIMLNLIMNSLKHGFDKKERGQIDIFINYDKTSIADGREHMVYLTYRDNGHGMSEETMKNIFEPFYTTKRDDGGSGLGMHIVYNLVTQRLDGQIECSSEINEYTEFKMYFPIDKI